MNQLSRYMRSSVSFVIALLLCACVAQPQSTMMSSQLTPVDSGSKTGIPATTATLTPLAVSTPAEDIPEVASTPAIQASNDRVDLVQALQKGGFVIYFRTMAGYESETSMECTLQPAIADRIRADAVSLGESFLRLGIPVEQVLHNDTCYAYETALLAFGRGESWFGMEAPSVQTQREQSSILRRLLTSPPKPGMNRVLIGNGLDIKNVTGTTLAGGETVIYQPFGKNSYSYITRMLTKEWEELTQNLPNLVQMESCDFGAIPMERISPLYGSRAQSQPGLELGDGGEGICVPEQQFSLSQDLPLPDLITLPPTDLRIRVNPVSGQKLLRFSNSIVNEGLGAMELWGTYNHETGMVTVDQRIFTVNGSSQNVTVGEFFFHTEHNHWHFGKFARYEIWTLGSDSELDSVVAYSNKISYCLRDDARVDIPGAPLYQTYTACDQNRQGISVGWIDTYRYHLVGQSVDITALPDGMYALRSVVDPDSKLWDRDYSNNAATLYIQIEGDRVEVIEKEDV